MLGRKTPKKNIASPRHRGWRFNLSTHKTRRRFGPKNGKPRDGNSCLFAQKRTERVQASGHGLPWGDIRRTPLAQTTKRSWPGNLKTKCGGKKKRSKGGGKGRSKGTSVGTAYPHFWGKKPRKKKTGSRKKNHFSPRQLLGKRVNVGGWVLRRHNPPVTSNGGNPSKNGR